MAEYWADSNAAPGGNGLSIDTPFNAIPGNTFGNGHTWNLKYGSVFDLGAAQLTSGNSTLVRAYGDPADLNPMFTGANATLFNCSLATGAITFEDITFMRSGAQGGTGLLPYRVRGASAHVTLRRCVVAGFNLNIDARETERLTVEGCAILGGSTTYGLRGQAMLTRSADNWHIVGNTFDCGTDIDLSVSDDALSLGSFNNLLIEGNSMIRTGGGGGTSMFLRGKGNATNYDAEASITGGNTLVRNVGGAWPAWPAGTVLFLAGWSNAANFGTVTVVSGGGTTSVVVTNLGATLVNETQARGKGAAVRDSARAFNNPIIRNNRIANRGLTPIFIDNFIGGVLENNSIDDTVAAGQVAAAIEAFNCIGTIARYNRIRRMTGPVTVDSMGIFWDGACENCAATGNYFSDIRPTSAAENSGAAMAAYFSKGCSFDSNIAENCKSGLWVGGIATTTVTCRHGTISGCDTGLLVNSSPAVGVVTAKNNVIQKCVTGIKDSASSVVANNAWWQNTVDNHFGTLAAKDAAAITGDPKLSGLRPVAGSSLIRAGLHLGYSTDADGVQRWNPPTIGAYEFIEPRTERT